MRQMKLVVFMLFCHAYSFPNDAPSYSVLNVTPDASQIRWHYTEGYVLTEEEVRAKNAIVLARWGLSKASDLVKRSQWADDVCAQLNNPYNNGWYGNHVNVWRFRSANCAAPGRSRRFDAKCGVWSRNGFRFDSNPDDDASRPGRCPMLTVNNSFVLQSIVLTLFRYVTAIKDTMLLEISMLMMWVAR